MLLLLTVFANKPLAGKDCISKIRIFDVGIIKTFIKKYRKDQGIVIEKNSLQDLRSL
jgi:hypothetical protein